MVVKIKIGIDIDNTITETSLLANCLVKNNVKYNEKQDYHNLNKEELKDFLTQYLEDIVYNVKLKPGVVETLKKWRELGYKIIFITARGVEKTDNLVNLKTLYLTSMYFAKESIPFDEIVFFKDSKVDTALDYNINLFIDDKENVLDEMNSAQINVLRMTNEKESKHQIVKNWLEIASIVERWGNK